MTRASLAILAVLAIAIPMSRLAQFAAIGIVCAVAAGAYAVEKAAPVELIPGDYELTVSSRSTAKATTRETRGHLFLRSLAATRELFGTPCRLYGWTDVDFQALGAPIAKSDAPRSQDPENPGVLVWEPPPAAATLINSMNRKIVHPPGAPIMLIGTVENRRATRGMRDGSGIGLFVESKHDQCVLGRWTHFGIAAGAEGHFQMCLRADPPPNKAVQKDGASRRR